MSSSTFPNSPKSRLRIQLCRNRKFIWWISGVLLSLSLLGLILCLINPSIRAPLKPGLDFTGGTQIQLERSCIGPCDSLSPNSIADALKGLPLKGEDSKSVLKLS